MASPGPIITQVIVIGSSWTPTFELKKADGTPYNLSLAGVDVTLRLLKEGETVVTRNKKTVGQTAFPSGGTGTDGRIIFIFLQAATAAFDPGLYIVEVVYANTDSSPPEKTVVGRGLLRVDAPRTGTI